MDIWQQAKWIIARAIELPASERAEFIAEKCGDQKTLRAEVEAMLAAHEEMGSFLNAPTAAAPNLLLATERVGEEAENLPRVGSSIGHYKLLEEIGSGGFGTVYLAQQEEPVRRRVALKVIKPGMDSKEIIARFEAERQALALMDHPNIAKVFDAGTTAGGHPYFVMELVKGLPITEYCDAAKMVTRERLSIFRDVCLAVQHAHQKGVIHRDIKPGNVLVTLHDGKPVPKVIDFGIAKATQGPLTAKTIFTRFMQFVGTPQYMSPEQTGVSALDIDTRSDLYSLGVLLYELLTGTIPFETTRLLEAGFAEIQRIIREEEPPTPSFRLSSMGEGLAEVAGRRGIDGRSLRKQLRGELDWIVMKCLEKDRNRRYETAVALADDIANFLVDLPVLARPPSGIYKLQKFARRNKALLSSVSGVCLAIVAGLALAIYGLMEARDERDAANKAQRIAREQEALAVGEAERALRAESSAEKLLYRATVTAAVAATNYGDVTSARRSLAESPEDLRNWEWSHLDAQVYSEILSRRKDEDQHAPIWNVRGGRILLPSTGRVLVLDASTFDEVLELDGNLLTPWSPGGDRIVMWLDGVVYVTDAATGVRLQTLATLESAQNARCEWSRDGAQVLLSTPETGTRVLDAVTGELLKEFAGQLMPSSGTFLLSARFLYPGSSISDDGLRLITVEGTLVRAWDTSSGSVVCRLEHVDEVRIAAWSPDGTKILTVSRDELARIWDVESGAVLSSLPCGFRFLFSSDVYAAWSLDGSQVFTVTDPMRVRAWDSISGAETYLSWAQPGIVPLFSPDEKRVLAWSGDTPTIQVYDGRGGNMYQVLAATEDLDEYADNIPLAWGPGNQLALSGTEGVLLLWKIRTGSGYDAVTEQGAEITHYEWLENGSRLLTTGADNSVRIWDTVTWEPILSMHADDREEGRSRPLWSPDRKRLANYSSPQESTAHSTTRVWDPLSGALQLELEARGRVQSAAWSGDGAHILTRSEVAQPQGPRMLNRGITGGGRESHAELWNGRSGESERLFPHTHSAEFNPTAPKLLTVSSVPTAKAWEASTGRDLGTLVDARRGTWSPTGEKVLLHSKGQSEAMLWDPRGGGEVQVLADVRRGWWSPDGSRLLTRSVESRASVRDGGTGEILVELPDIVDAVWSADGQFLLVRAGDASVRVWESTSGRELLIARYAMRADWSFEDRCVRIKRWDNSTGVFDSRTGEERLVFEPKLRLAWSPDESMVIATDSAGLSRLIDIETGGTIREIPDVKEVHWSPDSALILAISSQGDARVYSSGSDIPIMRFSGAARGSWGRDSLWICTFDPDGSAQVRKHSDPNPRIVVPDAKSVFWNRHGPHLLIRREDLSARVFDLGTGELAFELPETHRESWSPDGLRLWSLTKLGVGSLIDAATGEFLMSLSDTSQVTWSADGSRFWTYSRRLSEVTARGTKSGQELYVIREAWPTTTSPDESVLVSYPSVRNATVWDLQTGESELVIPNVVRASWTWDGRHLRVWTEDGETLLHDARSGERVKPEAASVDESKLEDTDEIPSPDGTRFISVGNRGFSLYDSESGEELLNLRVPPKPEDQLSEDDLEPESHFGQPLWSPDGKQIVVAQGNRILLWDSVRPAERYRQLRQYKRVQETLGPLVEGIAQAAGSTLEAFLRLDEREGMTELERRAARTLLSRVLHERELERAAMPETAED